MDGRSSRPSSWWGRLFKSEVKAPVVGYGGFWIVIDEAHISTIASDVKWRGHGIGELMLLAMIDRSIELGAHEVTLEVRASNAVAQNLYRKYGFQAVGRRPGYYRDNNEDADLMTVSGVNTQKYQAKLKSLRAALEDRLRQHKTRSAAT
jgi:ribosomal-protein-alanine N-acetyltransferase